MIVAVTEILGGGGCQACQPLILAALSSPLSSPPLSKSLTGLCSARDDVDALSIDLERELKGRKKSVVLFTECFSPTVMTITHFIDDEIKTPRG